MNTSAIPPCFYRVSVKALILDETRTKFLVVRERSGKWELPGGGLEWGATPQEDLPREIREEMGLTTVHVAEHPAYFLTGKNNAGTVWVVNVIYEARTHNLDITPSDECVEVRFVTGEEAQVLEPQVGNMCDLGRMFNPARHTQ